MEANYEEAVASCQTPGYHLTHRYCPSCPWTESVSLTCTDCGRQMERHRRANGNQRWDCECGLSRPYRGEDR